MKTRFVAATAVLFTVIALVVWSNFYLKSETGLLADMLGRVLEETKAGHSDAGEIFTEFEDEYKKAKPLMSLIVHKERFEDIDILTDRLSAYFSEGGEYENLHADIEELISLVYEIYEKSNGAPGNLF